MILKIFIINNPTCQPATKLVNKTQDSNKYNRFNIIKCYKIHHVLKLLNLQLKSSKSSFQNTNKHKIIFQQMKKKWKIIKKIKPYISNNKNKNSKFISKNKMT